MTLLHSDVRKILDILDSAKHLDHVEITIGDYVLKAGKSAPVIATDTGLHPVQAPSHMPPAKSEPPAATPAKTAAVDIPEGMMAVRSPMAGSFYLTPSPDEPPFVSVGDKVEKGDTVCLVEVMKMFNSVPAPISGIVHSILARQGQTVEMDEAILILEPEAAT